MAETKYANYDEALENDSKSFIEEFFGDLLEGIKDGSITDCKSFINEDEKLHSFLEDNFLSLKESFDIIENCKNEETNSSLWVDLPPKDAIVSMAFWSYKNDLSYQILRDIKTKLEIDILCDVDELMDKLDELIESHKETLDSEYESDENLVQSKLEELEKEKSILEAYSINLGMIADKF